MAICIRAKRVTDPLDERVRAQLRGEITGYASSGSDNDGGGSGGCEDLSCFSDLLHDFLNPTISVNDPYVGGDSDSDGTLDGSTAVKHAAAAAATATAKLRELLDPPEQQDLFRARLRSEVQSAAVAVALTPSGPAFRRAVMARLRERGYNAGICKARWEGGGGITGGSYEYIDVVIGASPASAAAAAEGERRYIVDMEFAAEFEVARATEEYGSVVKALPEVAVALEKEVAAAVRVVAEAARWSMKSCELIVPPWRKRRYMMAKWLGPYRRTVNALSSPSPSCVGRGGEVRCRAVGFGAVGGVGALPAERMR